MQVVLEAGGEKELLATAVAGILRHNIENGNVDPDDLKALSIDLGMVASTPTGDSSCTVSFHGDRVRIYPGLKEHCDSILSGEFGAIMALSRIPFYRGAPLLHAADSLGLGIDILKGRLKLTGAAKVLPRLLSLARVMSTERRCCPFVLR